MTSTNGNNGRLGNQIIRNLAVSLLAEKHNLAAEHPEIATHLRAKLTTWAAGLKPPGLASGAMAATWHSYYDFYLEGKPEMTAASAEGDEAAPKSSTRKQRRKAQ